MRKKSGTLLFVVLLAGELWQLAPLSALIHLLALLAQEQVLDEYLYLVAMAALWIYSIGGMSIMVIRALRWAWPASQLHRVITWSAWAALFPAILTLTMLSEQEAFAVVQRSPFAAALLDAGWMRVVLTVSWLYALVVLVGYDAGKRTFLPFCK